MSEEKEKAMQDALSRLEAEGGLEYDAQVELEEAANQHIAESAEKITSLGKPSTYQPITSSANESGWKTIALNTIPSKGLMYPENLEFLIRSAKTKEIRHWSTIDEYDPIDVNEKIAFVTESCSRIHLKGDPRPMNSNDILEVDKYQILFKIHRITFPNNENKLMAKVKCPNKSCGVVNSIHTTDMNLQGFEFPEELMEWYSQEERCFVINSEKLMETFRIYLPTVGSTKVFNDYKALCKRRGLEEDKAFDKMAPYLIASWREFSAMDLLNLRSESSRWPENKFLFLYRACEMLEKNSKNKVLGICEKCKTKIASSIFLGGSFTAKDIFIVSTRLRDLV